MRYALCLRSCLYFFLNNLLLFSMYVCTCVYVHCMYISGSQNTHGREQRAGVSSLLLDPRFQLRLLGSTAGTFIH